MSDAPLAGCGVLVTRPAHQSHELAAAIETVTALYLELRYFPDAPDDQRFRRAVRTLRT